MSRFATFIAALSLTLMAMGTSLPPEGTIDFSNTASGSIGLTR